MIVLTVAFGTAHYVGIGARRGVEIERIGDASPSYALLAAIAATHEEVAKLIIVVGLALFAPRHFNDPLDGAIYRSLAESIAYVD